MQLDARKGLIGGAALLLIGALEKLERLVSWASGAVIDDAARAGRNFVNSVPMLGNDAVQTGLMLTGVGMLGASLIVILRKPPTSPLAFDYKQALHGAPGSDGAVDVRVMLRNTLPTPITLGEVKIDYLEALSKKEVNADFANQFCGTPLNIVRGEPGMTMPGGDVREIFFLSAKQRDTWFHFHSHNESFRTPPGVYHLELIATTTDGPEARIRFNVALDAEGRLHCRQIDLRPATRC